MDDEEIRSAIMGLLMQPEWERGRPAGQSGFGCSEKAGKVLQERGFMRREADDRGLIQNRVTRAGLDFLKRDEGACDG